LDSGRVLLHQILYFCQSSHEWMPTQSWCYSIESWETFKQFNISTLKGLSINKCIVVSWSRPDKTTKQH
jgi:hypothetical protein